MLEEHYRTLNHITYRSPRYPDRQADNFLGYVKCVGNESKVLECPFKFLSGVDYPSMDDFLEPCDTSTCYRERAYQGIYGRNVNSSCRHKDLSVRCLTAGDQCCYTACRPHENQIYHRTIMYNNVPTCNITTWVFFVAQWLRLILSLAFLYHLWLFPSSQNIIYLILC